MLIPLQAAAFICKFAGVPHLLDTCELYQQYAEGLYIDRIFIYYIFWEVGWGLWVSMRSLWSAAPSLWQRDKVSQQVAAGCWSALQPVTSRRDTSSPSCHFASVTQREQDGRQADRQTDEQADRLVHRESFEVQRRDSG